MTAREERVEVPDTAYAVLDQASELLCTTSLRMDETQQGNLEVMLAELLNSIWARCDDIADVQSIPGKVQESVLIKNVPGYLQARNLAVYLVESGVLKA